MLRAMNPRQAATRAPRDTTLRDEQAARTRERILEGAIDLLADGALTELTVPLVASRAGVAVRTVYRYFPTKEALLEAVALLVDGRFGPQPFMETGGEVRALAGELFRHFETNLDLMRAGRLSSAGKEVFAQTRRSRVASCEQALEPLLEGMDEEERRRAVSVVYFLHSSGTYLYFRDTMKMDAEQATASVGWVVDLVMRDLEKAAKARRKPAEQRPARNGKRAKG